MTVFVVPTFSAPSWTQQTTFEGVSYALQFDFNQRACAYYMSVADADGVDIYNGVKVVCGFLLLQKCRDTRRPAGDLLCLSSTADASPPTFLDLLPGSGRCTLYYITSDWLATLRSGDAAAIAALHAQIASGNAASSPLSTYGQS